MNLLIHDLVGGNAPVRMKDERRGKCVSGQRERHPPQLPAESQHRSPNQFEEQRGPHQDTGCGYPIGLHVRNRGGRVGELLVSGPQEKQSEPDAPDNLRPVKQRDKLRFGCDVSADQYACHASSPLRRSDGMWCAQRWRRPVSGECLAGCSCNRSAGEEPSRRSSAPERSASANPPAARIAPTQSGEVQPRPAPIARPPRKAPAALARLNAEWFAAAARVGASRAFSMMRVWMIGTHAMPVAPIRNIVTAAASWLCAVTTKSARTSPRPPTAPYRLGMRARSASRPPTRLPTVMPRPKSASSRSTALGEYPATFVIIGSM